MSLDVNQRTHIQLILAKRYVGYSYHFVMRLHASQAICIHGSGRNRHRQRTAKLSRLANGGAPHTDMAYSTRLSSFRLKHYTTFNCRAERARMTDTLVSEGGIEVVTELPAVTSAYGCCLKSTPKNLPPSPNGPQMDWS